MIGKKMIDLKTEIPGPKAKEYLERDKNAISPSYVRPYGLVAKYGEGLQVEDIDGNLYLDFSAGVAVNTTGHRHPEIVKAIKDQADKLIHMSGTDFFYPEQIELAEKIKQIAPGESEKMVWYGNSGAEAVEAGLKLARWHTKRPMAIAFFGAFHGRTYGAISLSGSKPHHKEGFSPLLGGIVHVPYPYCYRCSFNTTPDKCNFRCVDFIEETMHRVGPPKDVAVVVVEPIQGEGGYVVPPDGYFQRLKQLLDHHSILFMADEVQSGFGRTGKMFAIEHWGVEPDIMALAKGIASGMPLGVMVSKKSVMNWKQGAHGSTFGGNPISCVASLKTIELLEKGLMENAKVMGDYILENLKEMQKRHPIMGDIRGKGLMIGIEFVKDEHKAKAKEEAHKFTVEMFKKGVLLLPCGDNSVRISPSLTVNKEEIDAMLPIFEEVLTKTEKEMKEG